ncbi:MAG: DUF2065 domain-containing protein [Proteobacteria bacterium]|nr:DUF2065 domain-containing protein [Pseudomonadota bacterium]
MSTYGLKYFLSVLALVFIIEGIPYFLSPVGIKKWLAMVKEMSNSMLRGMGFFFILLGLAILYLALRVL